MTQTGRLRTPLIKPRTQGGSFYTFGSAIEDIGLNINGKNNRVELTHYALIDIPEFSSTSLHTNGTYTSYDNKGDMMFAESFQNYALNLETIVRNKNNYNFVVPQTCSEKIFWKWLFKVTGRELEEVSGKPGYYKEFLGVNENPIVKGFGQITANSQRSDDYGLYNETFVQIPSSYGLMECFFSKTPDENYNTMTQKYTCGDKIENIQDSEISNNHLKTTGLCATSISDGNNEYTTADSMYTLVLDINKLRSIYPDYPSLVYDDLGFGLSSEPSTSYYDFNAILVYYSIFDANSNDVLATNLYGIYIINKAEPTSATKFKFNSLRKEKTTSTKSGTSFSFRLNIKPTSVYSGDIQIEDNSTASYGMGEDFNDVLRNLNTAIRSLSSNSKLLYNIANDNKQIKQLASQAIDKVNDLELTVNRLTADSNFKENLYIKSPTTVASNNITKQKAQQALKAIDTGFDFSTGKSSIKLNNATLNTLTEDVQSICESIYTDTPNGSQIDIFKLLSVIVTAIK